MLVQCNHTEYLILKHQVYMVENRRRDVISLNQPQGMSAKMAANVYMVLLQY